VPARPTPPGQPSGSQRFTRPTQTHEGLRRSPTFATDARMNLRKHVSVIVPTPPHSSMAADEVP
ncbi:hypothetical protein, partial [Stenotrophomonas lactitubi]|uniref:hypothetical protein n=1 Tax=Stenotrophomonas lactitubi TaxID=2045214 RepID=UPI001E649F3A